MKSQTDPDDRNTSDRQARATSDDQTRDNSDGTDLVINEACEDEDIISHSED